MSGTWSQTLMVQLYKPLATSFTNFANRQPSRPLVVFMEFEYPTQAGGTRREHLACMVIIAEHIDNADLPNAPDNQQPTQSNARQMTQ
jgi:hypothetical protein